MNYIDGMTECVLAVTGTSPSLIWSDPGMMRGIISPTRTDAVDLCALTTHRYSRQIFSVGQVGMDLVMKCFQIEFKESICSQLNMWF